MDVYMFIFTREFFKFIQARLITTFCNGFGHSSGCRGPEANWLHKYQIPQLLLGYTTVARGEEKLLAGGIN